MKKPLSKTAIISAINERYGLVAGDVELVKSGGEYHWSGRAGACFTDTLAVTGNLSSWSLERWLEDFDNKDAELLGGKGISLKAYIDSIDWDIEYE